MTAVEFLERRNKIASHRGIFAILCALAGSLLGMVLLVKVSSHFSKGGALFGVAAVAGILLFTLAPAWLVWSIWKWHYKCFVENHREMNHIPTWIDAGLPVVDYPVTKEEKAAAVPMLLAELTSRGHWANVGLFLRTAFEECVRKSYPPGSFDGATASAFLETSCLEADGWHKHYLSLWDAALATTDIGTRIGSDPKLYREKFC
jgi:hypothetical protein